MCLYSQIAQAIKGMVEDGTLKPGKSVALKKVALAADLSPGRCVENLRGVLGMWLKPALEEAGVHDVCFEQIGYGRYSRYVFKRR